MKTYKDLFKTSFDAHVKYNSKFVEDKKDLEQFMEGVKLVNNYIIMAKDLFELEQLIDKARLKRFESKVNKPWYKIGTPDDLYMESLNMAKQVIEAVSTRWITGYNKALDSIILNNLKYKGISV